MAAMAAMNWAADWPALLSVEASVVRAFCLTSAFTWGSTWFIHRCWASYSLVRSLAEKAFLRARPAADRTKGWACSFESSRDSNVRYSDCDDVSLPLHGSSEHCFSQRWETSTYKVLSSGGL